MNAEAIREALRCDRPGCPCQRERGPTHCPGHDDAHPSFDVDEKDGTLLVHCHTGCSQESVIEALRVRKLWTGLPPAPKVKGPLFEVCRFIEQYVVMPSEHATNAVAAWIALAHVQDAFDIAPYLAILSPTLRAGKSQLLELIGLLTPRPWHIIQPSTAVLFRKLSAEHPTLLVDEAETIFTGHGEQTEPVRAVFNAGHRRGVVVPRCVGEGAKQKLVNFEVFGPKALAAIGTLPVTILDRSIVIPMRRATPAEQRRVQKLRQKRAAAEAKPIYDALAAWAVSAGPRFQKAEPPAVPDELDGRAADCWEPLLAVAADASDGFYALLWQAALVLSTGEAREEDSTRLRLLRDIQQVFVAQDIDRIGSAELVDALCLDDSSPWGDWAHGKRITPQAIAQLLRPFGIRPRTIRTGPTTPRGYHLEDFADAFSRYLAPDPSSPGSDPQQVQQFNQDVAFSRFPDPQQVGGVAPSENGANPHGDWIVAPVAGRNPPERGKEDGEAPLPPLAEAARRLFNGEIISNRPTPALFPHDDGRQAPDDEPLVTPEDMATLEDLAKGGGRGQVILRIGEGTSWHLYPYTPGLSIAPGKAAWLAFIRNNPVEELERAAAAMLTDPALGAAVVWKAAEEGARP